MTPPWSGETASACGIEWLLHEIAPAGGLGRNARKRERTFTPGDEGAARAALDRVARLANDAGADRLATLRAAIAAVPDPTASLVRARSGDVLGDVDFFELARFSTALASVARESHGDGFAGVEVPQPDETLANALAAGIGPDRSFYLADAFDASLSHARGECARRRAAFDRARSRIAARLRDAGVGEVRDAEFVVMREVLPAPFPPELRVLREAPTYLLCELALDDDALEAFAELDRGDAAVAAAEEAVRARLSHAVAIAAPALEHACALLGELDLLVARAAFAARYACVVPELVAGAACELEAARYPPLEDTLATRGRRYVPIDLMLDGVAVVTGPNMGGKTAALRTLGFAAACVALGVPVPARRARLPLVDEIVWLGIDAAPGGQPGSLLSAFGAEVVALRTFLERGARRSLVLLDEFARTTSAPEGRALVVALLETLRARGALALAATHLAGVAGAANVTHFAIGRLRALPDAGVPLALDEALERIASAMDYALVATDDAEPGASDALALAAALGLETALVERAAVVLRSSET